MSTQKNTRIAIAGAGFAGLEAAKVLARARGVEVLLIDRNAETVFIPMLYQVATAQVAPQHIADPIRPRFRRFPQVRCIQAEIEAIDPEQRRLRLSSAETLDYDYLILATGSRSRFLGVPGAAEHSLPMRTLAEAVVLRDRLLTQLRSATAARSTARSTDRSTPQSETRTSLSIIIVGGGPTGVELAGALLLLLRRWGLSLGQAPATGLAHSARIVLIQSGDRLFASYPPRLGRYAARWLRRRGIEVRLNQKVRRVFPQAIELEDGSQLASQVVIWTAGLEGNCPSLLRSQVQTSGGDENQSSAEVSNADASNPDFGGDKRGEGRQKNGGSRQSEFKPGESKNGKLTVGRSLQLPNNPNIYAVGDLSRVQTLEDALTGVAQEAIQQGRTAAQNILLQMRSQPPQPFTYRDKGRLAIIGRYAGIGQIGPVLLRGPLAWLLWLEVHWFYLPGWRNRLAVLAAWLGLRPPGTQATLGSPPKHSHRPDPFISGDIPMGIQKYFPLVGRTFLSSIFVYAGLNNLINYSSTVERVSGMLPAAGLAIAGNVLCCLLGSLSLILGFKTRWGALLLILFLVPTTLVFHPFWADGSETIAFLKNLSLIGALLFVNAYGPGPVSLDERS